MTGPERDTLIIGLSVGLSVGGTLGTWLGYRLCRAVGQFRARRATRHPTRVGRAPAKHIPFPSPGYNTIPSEQDTRRLLARPRVLPLTSKRHVVFTDVAAIDPSKVSPIHLPRAPGGSSRLVTDVDDIERARETVRLIREDALAALTGAGYKRAAAEAALDACTLIERASGLEHWVAAALRRAASKP